MQWYKVKSPKEWFRNINIILAEKQPKNLLRLLCKPRLNTDTNNFIQPKGLFICKKKRCKICSFYVNEDNSFIMSNNMGWEHRSHVTCRDINVAYYLKCNVYDHKETYIGKTVDAELINAVVIVEQIFPLVNFPNTYMIVPWKINI